MVLAPLTDEQLKQQIAFNKPVKATPQEVSPSAEMGNRIINKEQFVNAYGKAKDKLGVTMDEFAKMHISQGYKVQGWDEYLNNKAKLLIMGKAKDLNRVAPGLGDKQYGVETTGGSIVGGAISEIPKFVAGTISGALKGGEEIGKGMNKLQEIIFGLDPLGGTTGVYTSDEMVAKIGESLKEKLQDEMSIDPDSAWTKIGEFITDIGLSVAGGPKPTSGALTKIGALERGVKGGLEGLRYSLGDEGNFDVVNMGLGAVIEAGLPFAGKAIKSMRPLVSGKKIESIDDLIGKITQGTDETKYRQFADALDEFDFSGVEKITYKSLAYDIINRVKLLNDTKSSILGVDKRLFTSADTLQDFGEGIKKDYVKEALDILEGLFDEQGNIDKLKNIKVLKNKFLSEGLSGDEIDSIAKLFPSNIKSFGTTGQPLSSKFAVSGENIRKGLKEFIRTNTGIFGTISKDIDGRIANLLTLHKQIEKNALGVQKLVNKFKNRSLGEKIGGYIANTLDLFAFGGLKGFVSKLMPSNVGLKTMNWFELEKALGKRLQLLQELDNVPIKEFSSKKAVNEIILSKIDNISMNEERLFDTDFYKSLDNMGMPNKMTTSTNNPMTPRGTPSVADNVGSKLDDVSKELLIKKANESETVVEYFDSLRKEGIDINPSNRDSIFKVFDDIAKKRTFNNIPDNVDIKDYSSWGERELEEELARKGIKGDFSDAGTREMIEALETGGSILDNVSDDLIQQANKLD